MKKLDDFSIYVDGDPGISDANTRIYTMEDIKKLDEKIEHLEYYSEFRPAPLVRVQEYDDGDHFDRSESVGEVPNLTDVIHYDGDPSYKEKWTALEDTELPSLDNIPTKNTTPIIL